MIFKLNGRILIGGYIIIFITGFWTTFSLKPRNGIGLISRLDILPWLLNKLISVSYYLKIINILPN
jgi:hypothetical protein